MTRTRLMWFTTVLIFIAGVTFAANQQSRNQNSTLTPLSSKPAEPASKNEPAAVVKAPVDEPGALQPDVADAAIEIAPNQQPSRDQSTLLKQLHSDDWTVRATALGELISMPNALESDEVKKALIDLLDRENKVIATAFNEGQGASAKYGEGYSQDYYDTLLGTVDKIADLTDKRTLDVLARSSYNPDSPFAIKLASLGETIVPTMIELANSSSIFPDRGNALAVLGLVVQKYRAQVSDSTIEQIKQTLVKGTGDKISSIRRQAVQSLGALGDKSVIPLLERIAQFDPKSFQLSEGGMTRFPVREEALAAIRAIKGKQ